MRQLQATALLVAVLGLIFAGSAIAAADGGDDDDDEFQEAAHHNHIVAQATRAELLLGPGTPAGVGSPITDITLDIPDVCDGDTPVDRWNVLVAATANGEQDFPPDPTLHSDLDIFVEHNSVHVPENIKGTGLAPGLEGHFALATQWLFTEVGSGDQLFTLWGQTATDGNRMIVRKAVLVVNVLGFECVA